MKLVIDKCKNPNPIQLICVLYTETPEHESVSYCFNLHENGNEAEVTQLQNSIKIKSVGNHEETKYIKNGFVISLLGDFKIHGDKHFIDVVLHDCPEEPEHTTTKHERTTTKYEHTTTTDPTAEICDKVKGSGSYVLRDVINVPNIPAYLPKMINLTRVNNKIIWPMNGNKIFVSKSMCENYNINCGVESSVDKIQELEFLWMREVKNISSIYVDSNLVIDKCKNPNPIQLICVLYTETPEHESISYCFNLHENGNEAEVIQLQNSIKIKSVGNHEETKYIKNGFVISLLGDFKIHGDKHFIDVVLHDCPEV